MNTAPDPSGTTPADEPTTARRGRPPGWTHTDEARAKMSAAVRGKPKSGAHKAAIGTASRSMWANTDPETRAARLAALQEANRRASLAAELIPCPDCDAGPFRGSRGMNLHRNAKHPSLKGS